MIAGILELQMIANLVRLSDDMSQAKTIVGGAMNDINHVIGVTQKTLGALGFAFGSFSMGSFIKSAIDAEDAIYGLQQRTGSTAEEIAGLQYPASQTNTSLTELAGAAKHLANNMASNPDLFRRAGITAHDSIGALVQFSGIISAMPDGLDKTALATKALGKSGDELIQFLNLGPEALRAMIEEGKRYNPVTEENARLANEFNDNLDMLGMHSKALALNMANDLLPSLTRITTAMSDTAREGGLLQASLVGIGVVFTGIFTDDLLSREQQIAKRLEELRDLMASNQKWGTLGGLIGMGDQTKAEVNAISNEMIRLEQELERLRSRNKWEMEDDKGYTFKPKDPNAGKDLAAGLTGGADKDLKEQMDMFREWMRVLDVAPAQVRAYELAMKGATGAQVEAAQAVADYGAAAAAEKQQAREQMDTFREWMRVLDVAPEQVRAYELAMKGATAAQIEAAQAVADYVAAKKLQDAHTASDPLLAERSRYAKQLELLDQFHTAGLDSDAEYARRLEEARARHENNLVGIVNGGEGAMAAFKELSWQKQTESYSGFIMQMTSSAAGHNREMFELNKVASIANATISTYEGANKALGAFTPPYNFIAAAAVIAAGLVNVNTIMSTSFGGGSAASGGGGIPSMSTSTGVPVSVQNQSATVGVAAAPAKQYNLTLYGIDPNSQKAQFTYNQVFNELMPLIAEADGNGATEMNVIFA